MWKDPNSAGRPVLFIEVKSVPGAAADVG